MYAMRIIIIQKPENANKLQNQPGARGLSSREKFPD